MSRAVSRPAGATATLRRDVASAMLYLAPMQALITLVSFIAINRLDASLAWVGILGSAGYWGQLWNLALGRVTAKVDLRSGLALLMAAQGLLLAAAALQHSLLPYAALIIPLLVLFGLYEVQYATLVPHLYRVEERPRALGVRNFAVAASTALLAALFGRLSSGAGGHTPVFVLAGVAMVAGGLVFRGVRPAGPQPAAAAPRMPLLRAREIAGVLFGTRVGSGPSRMGPSSPGPGCGPQDGIVPPAARRAFRRLALVLILYGWYGAGLVTMLVVVYDRLGFDEWRVGLLAAVATLGTLLSSLLVAPKLRLLGGTSNFRLCFAASLVAILLLAVAVLFVAGRPAFWVLAASQFSMGIGVTGFVLGTHTAALNIAPAGREALFVNAMMVVLGLRGMLTPLLVAAVIRVAGVELAVLVGLLCVLCCTALVVPPASRSAGIES